MARTPKVVEDRVFLGDAVVFEALGKAHAMPVTVFLDQRVHAPFGVRGRLLGASAKEHVILDLETTYAFFEQRKFFVNRHLSPLQRVMLWKWAENATIPYVFRVQACRPLVLRTLKCNLYTDFRRD